MDFLTFFNDLNHQDHVFSASTGTRFMKSAEMEILASVNPANQEPLGKFRLVSDEDYSAAVDKSLAASKYWRQVPAPERGELVREIGELLRKYKPELGKLVSMECGKIYQEALGEVQEMIDICDFAVGLSRQLYGLTMHSERPNHRMYEQWHPLGVVGIISAFNFPVAVWSWNAMVAAVCGNAMVWKPSEKVALTAVSVQLIVKEALNKFNLPEGLFSLVLGDKHTGQLMARDKRIALLSATGSVPMGRSVGQEVAARMGKSLLELGGNNALIVSPHANLDLALRAIVFGACGTAGQRCTSTRRLIVHEDIYEQVRDKLVHAYAQLKIGNPLDADTLVGPLIDKEAVENYQTAIESVQKEGGHVLAGGQVLDAIGNYVEPALVEASNEMQTVQQETFAPILYLIKYSGEIQEAIDIQNNVPQGLSSALFSDNLQETEQFLSAQGSDCGIANVNIGTSGAEIGGAFGGEKETGGGRESGSDAWKAYMRRQTNTINYGKELPLAQGIEFNLD